MIGRAAVGLALLAAVEPFAAAASPPRWTVVAEESQLGFVATQMGTRFDGRFLRFDCDIVFAPDDLAASRAVVTIDMAAAETGNRERDSLLPGAPWFNVQAFPQARFETTGFRALGDNRFEARGNLTIRGRTREVIVPVAIEITGDRARVTGATTINRTDFDVGTGEWASGAVVGHAVEIRFSLQARRER
jgi:polyisoprenoid-binding protein YceI